MKDYPKSVSQTCTKKILEQMENSFYKVYKNEGKFKLEQGFFPIFSVQVKLFQLLLSNLLKYMKKKILEP